MCGQEAGSSLGRQREAHGRLAVEQECEQTHASGRWTSVGLDGWEGGQTTDGNID